MHAGTLHAGSNASKKGSPDKVTSRQCNNTAGPGKRSWFFVVTDLKTHKLKETKQNNHPPKLFWGRPVML